MIRDRDSQRQKQALEEKENKPLNTEKQKVWEDHCGTEDMPVVVE